MCIAHQNMPGAGGEPAAPFEDALLATFNQGALCLMLSVGHRAGLFDAMSGLSPSTSGEIAATANLNERYVREWLGAMVTGGVVHYDAETGRYVLPAEHARSLTRVNPAGNMAVFAQYIPILGTVEDDILRCFREGGGVPYERFPRFHDVMEEDSGQTVLGSLLDHILPLVDGLQDRLRSGIRVLDAGCGRGRALKLLAETYPRSSFVGYDLSASAIAHAREQAERAGLSNLRYEARDLSDFDQTAEEDAYDLVTTFDAVHDQARPLNLLKGLRRALKPGGVYLMQDIHSAGNPSGNAEHPLGTLLYTVSCMHCMTVSLAQDGDGLGAMWGREKARELLAAAGFGRVDIHRLEHDPQNDYYVIREA